MVLKQYVANDNKFEKARKKPYGHKEYVRRSRTGKMIQVPAKGTKPSREAVKGAVYKVYGEVAKDLRKHIDSLTKLKSEMKSHEKWEYVGDVAHLTSQLQEILSSDSGEAGLEAIIGKPSE